MLASWDFTSSTVVRFSKERAFFSRGVPPKRLRIEVMLAPPPAASTLRRSTSEDFGGIPSTSCSSSVVGDSGLSSGFATSYQERIGATEKTCARMGGTATVVGTVGWSGRSLSDGRERIRVVFDEWVGGDDPVRTDGPV